MFKINTFPYLDVSSLLFSFVTRDYMRITNVIKRVLV